MRSDLYNKKEIKDWMVFEIFKCVWFVNPSTKKETQICFSFWYIKKYKTPLYNGTNGSQTQQVF